MNTLFPAKSPTTAARIGFAAWRRLGAAGQQLLGVLLLLAIWAWAGRGDEAYYISSPQAVGAQLLQWLHDGTIWPHLAATLTDTLSGFALAALVAIPLAVLVTAHRFVGRVFQPFILVAVSIPKVIVAPLLILWVGIGDPPAITLAFVSAFFVVFFNAQSGLAEVPPVYLSTAAILGAGRWATAVKFRIPAAAPFIATGLYQGLIYAFHGAILGEMTASDRGLGYLIAYAATSSDSAAVIAGLAVVGVISLLLTGALRGALGRRLANPSQWEPTT